MFRLARDLPLFIFVLAVLLTALAYGTVHRLTAHAARTAAVTIETVRADEQGQMPLHAADCDTDVGPGDAESILAQHPAAP
jgi:hypothetical protein